MDANWREDDEENLSEASSTDMPLTLLVQRRRSSKSAKNKMFIDCLEEAFEDDGTQSHPENCSIWELAPNSASRFENFINHNSANFYSHGDTLNMENILALADFNKYGGMSRFTGPPSLNTKNVNAANQFIQHVYGSVANKSYVDSLVSFSADLDPAIRAIIQDKIQYLTMNQSQVVDETLAAQASSPSPLPALDTISDLPPINFPRGNSGTQVLMQDISRQLSVLQTMSSATPESMNIALDLQTKMEVALAKAGIPCDQGVFLSNFSLP